MVKIIKKVNFSSSGGGEFKSISKQSAYSEKKKIAIISITASLFLAFLKLGIGVWTNSLAILSESMHSGLDVVAAIMTFYAIKMSIKPPDQQHPYGYAKFESLTSLAEIVLLFIVSAWIFYEGLERILVKNIEPDITIFSFGVMIVSILIDYNRSRSLYKVARLHGSQALEADALHFRADMITSAIVIIGLIAVLMLKIPNADSYAALAIACIIIYTSLGLGRRTLNVLLDKAPSGVPQKILESISGLDGIINPHNIRVRSVGSQTFVDMHIEVPRYYSHNKAHTIATTVEERIREIIPNGDIIVHVDATSESETETISDKIRLIAFETEGIKNIHSLYYSILNDDKQNVPQSYIPKGKDELKLHLYLDVQMDGNLDFKTAHEITERFENRIRLEISQIENITTHIETEKDLNVIVGKEKNELEESIVERIKNMALSVKGVTECKDIGIINIENQFHITLTIKIRMSAFRSSEATANQNSLTVEEAHQIATDVQNLIINNTASARVIVHTEPEDQISEK